MTLAIARLNVPGENGVWWLNDAGDPHAPSVVSWGPNRLDVFVRGQDNRVYHKWWDGSGWGPSADANDWHILGGGIADTPTLVSWGANRLDLFVRGLDNRVYHKWWGGASWGPSANPDDWEVIVGLRAAALTAVSWGPNRIDLVARGLDGNVYRRYWNGSRWIPDA